MLGKDAVHSCIIRWCTDLYQCDVTVQIRSRNTTDSSCVFRWESIKWWNLIQVKYRIWNEVLHRKINSSRSAGGDGALEGLRSALEVKRNASAAVYILYGGGVQILPEMSPETTTNWRRHWRQKISHEKVRQLGVLWDCEYFMQDYDRSICKETRFGPSRKVRWPVGYETVE